MRDEITAAAEFLTRLVGKNESLTKDKVDQFQQSVEDVLNDKFKTHWFPDKPNKGQAYRCIRINGNIRREPALELVCKNIGMEYSDLMLPLELTLWIDPEDVTCRCIFALMIVCFPITNVYIYSSRNLDLVNTRARIVPCTAIRRTLSTKLTLTN